MLGTQPEAGVKIHVRNVLKNLEPVSEIGQSTKQYIGLMFEHQLHKKSSSEFELTKRMSTCLV